MLVLCYLLQLNLQIHCGLAVATEGFGSGLQPSLVCNPELDK